MKRTASIAGMLFLAALGLAAAVWDGSAVAGGAGDFPDEGFYGACNSFPRDTSVTVTNLENGKTVTVIITRNVDNPGVFIALSPKAAAELGMHAGAAARIRAVALVASQAETTLPPTRAGETADPDYNPKVYVDREKAAIAAAAAAAPTVAAVSPPAAPAAAAVAPAAAPAAAPSAAVKPAAAATASPAAIAATPGAPERAEIYAKVGEPAKQPTPPLPSLNEPAAAAKAPAAAAAIASAAVAASPQVNATPAVKAASPKPPAERLPIPEASPVFPGSPRPLPLGVKLPTPDVLAVPPSGPPTAHSGYLAQAPEILGETKPSPKRAMQPRLVIADPALPQGATPPAKAAVKTTDKAAVSALTRPPRKPIASKLALAEPALEFAPEELPDAIISRLIAPTKLVPTPVLADAQVPGEMKALRQGPEALAFQKPSYAPAVEAAALAEGIPLTPSEAVASARPSRAGGEGAVANLAEAELPGSPEAFYSGKPGRVASSSAAAALDEAALPGSPEAIAARMKAGESGALAELQVPDTVMPTEGIAGMRPRGIKPGEIAAELAEPGVLSPTATGSVPMAIADLRKGPGYPPTADLTEPAVPAPTESLTAGRPGAVAPGQAIAELAEPNPNREAAAAAAAAAAPSGPETATAVAAEKPARAGAAGNPELANPAVPSPTESIAATRPTPSSGGERTVTLEPASPRPPMAAVTAPSGAGAAQAKPEQPAAVATIKGPSPLGAAQAPTSVPMIKGLTRGSFYVQIGVYGTNDALQTSIAGFKSSSYPLAVEKLTTKSGGPAYRLFVGPLSRDESGVVLIRIRSLGFKDAYVKQGS